MHFNRIWYLPNEQPCVSHYCKIGWIIYLRQMLGNTLASVSECKTQCVTLCLEGLSN